MKYTKKEMTAMHKTIRRLTALLLCAAILTACLPLTAAAARFPDVPSGAWYAAAVEDMAQRGIMGGKSDGSFDPKGSLSRAEFATMLARSALPESELAKYDYRGAFSDVGVFNWANRYINWASENGVVKGTGSGQFSPKSSITRQDMAVMLVNYARAMGISIPPVRTPPSFSDSGSISGYARSSVDACVRAGILQGDGSGFRPKSTSMRCEAAQMFSAFLRVGQEPRYDVIRRRVSNTSVAAVEFDPHIYNAEVVMGSGHVTGAESITSIVDRTGADIAVNGSFFDMNSYTPYATIINGAQLVMTFNLYSPAKSAIVMDGSGRWSVENFYTYVTLRAYNPDGSEEEAREAGVNLTTAPGDGMRVVYTRAWGRSLGFAPKYAARVDGSGYVTAVYRDRDVEIPENGYLVVQRADRPYANEFIRSLAVGTYMEKTVEYRGASTQDIALCLGVGPKLVEYGRPYGDSGTYAAEGLSGINNFNPDRRVCIGVKYDGSLVILTAYASLPKLSEIMAELGCESAVNLDGGGSANLFAGGCYFTGPRSRLMNNVLVFKEK